MPTLREYYPEAVILTGRDAKTCLKSYMLWGWSGYVPKTCHNTWVPIPKNYRNIIWGWPYRFEARLQSVGSRSLLLGDFEGVGSTGIDTPEDLKAVPERYQGVIQTDKIEVVGPLLKAR